MTCVETGLTTLHLQQAVHLLEPCHKLLCIRVLSFCGRCQNLSCSHFPLLLTHIAVNEYMNTVVRNDSDFKSKRHYVAYSTCVTRCDM
jgi:hypothetical protein